MTQSVLLGAATCMLMLTLVHSQAFMPETMVDAIDGAFFLNSFKDAADTAGFLEAINSPNFTGTVFAPSDLGFDAFLATTSMNMTAGNLSAPLLDSSTTIAEVIGFHIVPEYLFPMNTAFVNGDVLMSEAGLPLYVDILPSGIIHIYGNPLGTANVPNVAPLNFGTILQYQQIKGGKAVLYVIDKVIIPPMA